MSARDLLWLIGPRAIIIIALIALSARSEISNLDRVAIGALDKVILKSKNMCREFGGTIRVGKTKADENIYHATSPVIGTNNAALIIANPPLKFWTATYHTHGCYEDGYDEENFSRIDTLNSKVIQYLGTPSHRILKFSIVDRKVYELDRTQMQWIALRRNK